MVYCRSIPDDFHGGDLREEHVSSSKLISYMQLVHRLHNVHLSQANTVQEIWPIHMVYCIIEN